MERGTPAIQPRSDSIPAFTEQDVRVYLSFLNGGSLMGSRIILLGQPLITRVVFTTIHDLDRAHGERYLEANHPAELPICYVELSGDFLFVGPPGSGAPQRGRPGTAFILFDARTGNHLVTGAPAHARWDQGP